MKKILYFTTVFLVCLSIVHGSQCVLKPSVEVSTPVIKIKDVINCSKEFSQRAGNIVIAVSPEIGSSTTISRREITAKLAGNGISDISVNGADQVRIIRKGIILKPSYFKGRITEYIRRNSKWKDGITITIRSSRPVITQSENVRWQIIPANGNEFIGNILFKIKGFDSSGREINSFWLSAALKIRKKVAIAKRTIRKNETISDDMIRWEEREITPFIRNALLYPESLIGERAGRIIRENSVLTEEIMAKKFLVRRGSNARVTITYRGMKASSTVKVLKNGAIGDFVKVMNTNSKKILTAEVTGKNSLKVVIE